MSWLEFISSLKWPITVLLIMGIASRKIHKHPALVEGIKQFIAGRNIRAAVGGTEFELSRADVAVHLGAAAGRAAQPDDALEEIATVEQTSPSATQLRREAVEDLVRNAVRMARVYMLHGIDLAEPEITWMENAPPKITFPGPRPVKGMEGSTGLDW